MSKHDSTKRFSDRAEDYAKYRPHYPNEIVSWLVSAYNLSPTSTIADIGAGTGISSELFLNYGYAVTAVEPNQEMRNVAIDQLKSFEKFQAIAGTAEQTSLEDSSVDLIVSAQAFHWFDAAIVRPEFERILTPNGLVALIWNERLTETAFEKAYEQHILDYASDYVQINHRNIGYQHIQNFFAPYACEMKVFSNQQVLDYESLRGRHLSSSYIPQVGSPGYESMIADLQKLFLEHKEGDFVKIHYATKVYVCIIGS
ncbi:class I SAM-dependent methyltransferase [Sphingobacterium hungaricum]|uniref:Class I SAM-dependent methyltransferase n=1 Tax=Sphingobacterium hungaricum TaxID=2082723 RepID=A0A928UX58_9SPHI|nr:class I SAM-dependent methyltransferase [Sphingobacterium hungaricum]MBE8712397.1 class I SAM-dependent methyltransferase [Sphingobacterium hungaricum]